MVHVDDVLRALRLAVEHPRASGEVYLATDGQVYTTREKLSWYVARWVRLCPVALCRRVLRAIAGVGGRYRPYARAFFLFQQYRRLKNCSDRHGTVRPRFSANSF